ncbi:hypothetical protein CLU79DRAFT_723689 [Phycomyces nitens]|nr:hypothetical protein CLU79DRAFT_724132 [Phycomyces nitens]KAI9006703.1 hypothetical protein CLU79DRAFT_723689 [Phycomyces nitens]
MSVQQANNSPILAALSDLSMSEAAAPSQPVKSLAAISRLRERLSACTVALADAIEQDQPDEAKAHLRQSITSMEGDLTLLLSAHAHLVRPEPVFAAQTAHQSRVVPRMPQQV